MMKNARQEAILKLIEQYEIETQEELASRLGSAGFTATQATVSRDIRALSLHKVQGSGGRLHSAVKEETLDALSGRYKRALVDACVSMDPALNLVVIHTVSGMAMAAAAAIDHMGWEEVLGCIAGDDTIIAVIRSPEQADIIRKRIDAITGG